MWNNHLRMNVSCSWMNRGLFATLPTKHIAVWTRKRHDTLVNAFKRPIHGVFWLSEFFEWNAMRFRIVSVVFSLSKHVVILIVLLTLIATVSRIESSTTYVPQIHKLSSNDRSSIGTEKLRLMCISMYIVDVIWTFWNFIITTMRHGCRYIGQIWNQSENVYRRCKIFTTNKNSTEYRCM